VDFVAVCFIGGGGWWTAVSSGDIDLWLVNDKLLSHKDVTKTPRHRRVKLKLFSFPMFLF